MPRFRQSGTFVEREDGQDASSLVLRDVQLDEARQLHGRAGDGTRRREVTWTVYATGPRKAKNVILFIGDGMSPAHRVAARILSKGIAEGKASASSRSTTCRIWRWSATAGSDSIITDSANSASAYATGHKSAVNAMGVYADRTARSVRRPEGRDHHRAWPSAARLAVGIVTNTEIEDATPAAMVAHTRRRADLDRDRRAIFRRQARCADGRRRWPISCRKAAPGSKRKDDNDYSRNFRDAGYTVAIDRPS